MFVEGTFVTANFFISFNASFEVYSSKLIASKVFASAPPNETSPSRFSLVTYQVGAFRVFQAITATFPLLAFALEG